MLAEQPDRVRALAALLAGPGAIRPADWLFVLVMLVLTAVLLLAVRSLWQMQRELTRLGRQLDGLKPEPVEEPPDTAVAQVPEPEPSFPADLPEPIREPEPPPELRAAPAETVSNWVYPLETEEKLLDAVRTGRHSLALELFDQLENMLHASPDDVFRQVLHNVALNMRQLMYDFNESELDPSIAGPDLIQQLDQVTRAEASGLVRTFADRLSGAFQKRASQKQSDIVVQAKTFIEANYRSSLTVNAIAAALFISAPYLYRLMREEVGISPAHYLNNLRIRHATRLLRTSDKNVAQVAGEAGFETEQCFFRQFKKQMDCTPNQYRNRYSTATFSPLFGD